MLSEEQRSIREMGQAEGVAAALAALEGVCALIRELVDPAHPSYSAEHAPFHRKTLEHYSEAASHITREWRSYIPGGQKHKGGGA